MPDGFGARLKELRRKAQMTQQALARAAGLSVAAVARIEQGGNPAPETIIALERALSAPKGALGAHGAGAPASGSE